MNGDAGPALGNTDRNQADPQEPVTVLTVHQEPAATLAEVAAPVLPPFYVASRAEGPLRQAEILSNVHQHKIALESLSNPEGIEVDPIDHELTIILSQDCDLEQDFKRREELRVNGTAADTL